MGRGLRYLPPRTPRAGRGREHLCRGGAPILPRGRGGDPPSGSRARPRHPERPDPRHPGATARPPGPGPGAGPRPGGVGLGTGPGRSHPRDRGDPGPGTTGRGPTLTESGGRRRRTVLVSGLVVAGTLGVALLGLALGSVAIPAGEFLEVLRGRGSDMHRLLVLELRAPRVLLGLLVGGGLALAGAVFQALLRNPLAEPYILGVSGGAAAGAVTVLSLGLAAATSWHLPAAAFAGALVAIGLVFGVAISADRRLDVRVLLLSGVVVGAFFSAFIALVISVSDAPTVRSAVLWMMGSLSGATWATVGITAAYTIPAGLLLLALARPLNLMAIGEETAGYLGTEVEQTKRLAYGVASLVAAAGVAFAGVIGFVGLIIPHSVRLLVGPDHRALLPLSFVAGAGFLVLADLGARMALAPTEIPIGVITAFVGVPFFLLLLRRSLSP
ncbi:MAG: iron ABC transporter permease [Gemmatimonadales bacterium]|nr:MAG: iron ABC transporter permease [Gemmatimonadales bacterium]